MLLAPLLCPFAAVAFAAEHLAVLFRGAPALAPRSDVVALHLFEGIFLLAMGADVVLLFPYGKFDVFGEGA